ncbi:unnamed protein product [Aphanomyces euteiches]|nr:hypothetical protein Ae201684P_014657 [Aphanomyces euteiches]
MSDDQYPRYDTTITRLSRDDCEVFGHEDNRDGHIRAEFFCEPSRGWHLQNSQILRVHVNRGRNFTTWSMLGLTLTALWLPMILIVTPAMGVRHLPPLRTLYSSLQGLLDTSQWHADRVLIIAALGRSNDVRVPVIVLVLAVESFSLVRSAPRDCSGALKQDVQPATAFDFAVLRNEVADCAAKLLNLHALVEKVATSVEKVVSVQAPVDVPPVVIPAAYMNVSIQSDESVG